MMRRVGQHGQARPARQLVLPGPVQDHRQVDERVQMRVARRERGLEPADRGRVVPGVDGVQSHEIERVGLERIAAQHAT